MDHKNKKPVGASLTFLFTYENKLVLVRKKYKEGKKEVWGLPGGKTKKIKKIREDAYTAARREVGEELGAEIAEALTHASFTEIRELRKEKENHILYFFKTDTHVREQKLKAHQEIEDAGAFSKEEVFGLIREGKVFPCHAEAILKSEKLFH